MFLSHKSHAAGNLWRVVGLNALIVLAAIWSKDVKAAPCKISKADQGEVDVAVYYISLGNLPTFDPMLPEGKVLATGSATMSGAAANISCSPKVGNTVYTGIGNMESRYRTFPTNVAGIGVRVGTIGEGGRLNWWEDLHVYEGAQGINYLPIGTFRVELVKTGEITAGGSLSGDIAMMRLQDFNQTGILVRLSGSVPIKPLVPTCKLTSTDKSFDVPLGPVSQRTLMENPASAAKSFNIQLTCSGGTQNATTKMYMGMTDASSPGNTSDILTLSANSKAKGVGVRIMRNGVTAVKFTPNASIAGDPNQWYVGQFGNVLVDMPFTAYFVPNGDSIVGGAANATATYTISYQ